MILNTDLGPLLLGNLGAVAVLLGLAWRRGALSVGLPLCYLLSLGTIHFAGAWISTLPAGPSENAPVVALGFREYFAGVVAFTGGVLAVDLLAVRLRTSRMSNSRNRILPAPDGPPLRSRGRTREPGGIPQSAACAAKGSLVYDSRSRGVPGAYVLLGAASALAFPLFRSIPSLAALVHCGSYLLVVGVCLGCFLAWRAGRHGLFLAWLVAAALFPAFTILTAGFIGYGAFATLMVLSFAAVLYRPRWLTALSLTLLAYVALSVYVTYMRDRDQMREAVWSGQAYATRIEKLHEIFARFEFFRPSDGGQLQAIEDRLNQNYLVGAARSQLESGSVTWAHGRTLWRAMLAMVPRILWPQKPVVAGSGNLVSEYTGLSFAEFTSVGVGQVMEFYINFGRPGVVLGFSCLGVLLRLLDLRAAWFLRQKRYADFALWYLPGLAFMQTGGSLVEISGTCATSVVLALAANKFGMPLVLRFLVISRHRGILTVATVATPSESVRSKRPRFPVRKGLHSR